MAKIKFDLKGDGRVGPQLLISFYDMMQFEECKNVVLSNDEEAFKDMLWNLGMNIENDTHEIVECKHRPKSLEGKGKTKEEEIWFGPAVIGSHRIDQDWVNSGYADWETKVAALSDPSLRGILNSMGKQVVSDTAFN
ncbi:hypothetical protein D3C85_1061020 [compost metagenome]